MISNAESEVWALRDQLQQLHAGLHPSNGLEREAWARALRHLKNRDPNGVREVRELVVGASRGLKEAFVRIEKLLDADEFDPFADQEGDEPKEVFFSPALPPSLAALALKEPFSPTRKAAARRSVGRALRTEKQEEKWRFFDAAKRHELPLNRKSEAAMLQAMSEYLSLPIASRRDVSPQGWARCASASETEDLPWGKP